MVTMVSFNIHTHIIHMFEFINLFFQNLNFENYYISHLDTYKCTQCQQKRNPRHRRVSATHRPIYTDLRRLKRPM